MGAVKGLEGGGYSKLTPGNNLGNGAVGMGPGNGKALGGMFGTAGGAGGSGFDAPSRPDLQVAADAGQVQAAQGGVDNSLTSQNALLAALQGQNGMGQQNAAGAQQAALAGGLAGNNGAANQASAYGQTQNLATDLGNLNGLNNSSAAMAGQGRFNQGLANANGIGAQTAALGQQQGFNNQLAAANGIGTQGSAISGLQNLAAQQQGTANQYQNIANGTGPNPAQAMLNQQTGQNVANQAALMAGQRGAGANVGLMARQAAQQGANTQQQAVGQGATMQANQQIAGLQGLAAQQQAMGGTQQAIGGLGTTQAGMQQAGIQNMAGQGAQLTGQQQAGLNAQQAGGMQQIGAQQAQQGMLAGQAQNQVANQMAANAQQAGQANTIAGQQMAGTNAAVQSQLANTGQLQGALGNYNSAIVSGQNSVNAGNTTLAANRMGAQNQVLGGIMSAAGGAMMAAEGGIVHHMADGGIPGTVPVSPMPMAPVAPPPPQGPQSALGQYLSGGSTGDYLKSMPPITATNTAVAAPTDDSSSQNQQTNQPLYQGTKDFAKGAMSMAMGAKGGKVERDFRSGGGVKAASPSEKAEKPGNSYANDKVKALLSEGEIVLPREVTQSSDPVRSAADFVSKVIAKRKRG